MFKRLLILTSAACLVSTIATAKTLTADDIKEKLIGKKQSFVTKDGFTGNVRYSKNGKAKLWKGNFTPSSDSGKWWFEGNKICNQWKVIRGGQPKCSSIRTSAGGKYKNADGTIITVR